MESIGAFLHDLARQYGASPALHSKAGGATETWSYALLWEHTTRVALKLKAEGIKKGDRVILWGPNGPWWVASFFGALRLGAILVPLDIRSGTDYVQRVVEQSEPKLALLGRSIKPGLELPMPVLFIDDFASLPPAAEQVEDDVRSDDIAEIVFTSGATGAPKGVILTHGNMLASLESTNQYVPSGLEFRIVSLLPLSHALEQVVGMMLALRRHSSIFYLSKLQPDTIIAALKEHHATAMVLVPQVLHLIMTSLEREVEKQGKQKQWERARRLVRFLPKPLRRRLFNQVHERFGGMLEFFVTGSAPMDPELIQKWELMGIAIIQGYGMTEAAGAISATPMEDRGPETVGRIVPGMQVKIAEDGEILVKGANITPGYWHNPQATQDAFDEDGWFRTGDLGQFDAQGHLYLHGRKKDMIALASGQKVYPLDIEQVLITMPGVKDAAVVGLPTPTGHEVHAVLLLDPDVPSDPDAIMREANTKLATHQRIRGVTVWPEPDLPRTFTFKVKKHEVLKALLEMKGREERERISVASVS
jgi:long-chain acyl-CoA synthetase